MLVVAAGCCWWLLLLLSLLSLFSFFSLFSSLLEALSKCAALEKRSKSSKSPAAGSSHSIWQKYIYTYSSVSQNYASPHQRRLFFKLLLKKKGIFEASMVLKPGHHVTAIFLIGEPSPAETANEVPLCSKQKDLRTQTARAVWAIRNINPPPPQPPTSPAEVKNSIFVEITRCWEKTLKYLLLLCKS